MLPRICKGREFFEDLSVFVLHGADFRDRAVGNRKAGGLNIKDHEFGGIQLSGCISVGGPGRVVHKVGFHSVKHLQVGFHRVVQHQRVGLHIAVIGHGNRVPSPLLHGIHQKFGNNQSVHCGQIGVQMQLHPLFGSVVGFFDLLDFLNALGL